jgi:hypothetical protein
MSQGRLRSHHPVALVCAAVGLSASLAFAAIEARADVPAADGAAAVSLDAAQLHFYSARYGEAAALTRELCARADAHPSACELRTSALHFQIKRALGDPKDKAQALNACAACPALMDAFLEDLERGRTLARARLQLNPGDEEALFLLGKLHLNYVWLQLGTLGRKTAWSEYWEARHSLDDVLARNPAHVRARVARAWIDYIVGTKTPFGVRWLLGGGNKKRGLLAVREAAKVETDFYAEAEAGFALWDMQVREKDFTGAIATARELVRDFPENSELIRFLERHATP